jgi:hypothetical protein
MSQTENSIVPANIQGMLSTKDDAAFNQVAKTGDYLPRLQLCGSSTKIVKRNLIGQGLYALVWDDENFKDLGNGVEALVIDWHPKALEIGKDQVVAYYDANNTEFQRIQSMSDVEDSGCMAGPEYLLWLPTVKELCTYHMSSKSARRASGKVHAIFKDNPPDKRIVRLTATLVEKGRFSWHAPVVNISSAPLVSVPDWTDVRVLKAIKGFANPNQSAAEKAPEAAGTERAR